MVYLLCFHEKYKHAKHYIGFAQSHDSFEKRMACHRSGRGANLLKVIAHAGIGFEVARTWPDGDRTFERKLKNRKNSKHLCPLCSAEPPTFGPFFVLDTESGGMTNNGVQVYGTIKQVADSYKPKKETG